MSAAFKPGLEPEEAHISRKAQLLQPVALGVAVILGIGCMLTLSTLNNIGFAVWLLVAALISVGGWWLARQRQVVLGTLLVILAFSSTNIYVIVTSEDAGLATLVTLPFMLLQIAIAALLLDSGSVLLMTAIAVLLMPAILLLPTTQNTSAAIPVGILAFLALGGVTWLTTRQFERTLHASTERSNQLTQSEAVLQEQTEQLRQQSLTAEAKQQEAVRALNQLQTTIHERDELARSLQEATLPLLPVHQHVLVMPLIGTVDSSRAALLNEAMLHGIEQQRARAVIIDVTGVPIVDTQVAGAILRAAEAARLLGSHTILVGIRPEVAQTIVGLGVDLSNLTVRSDLESGIKVAMRMIDQRAYTS